MTSLRRSLHPEDQLATVGRAPAAALARPDRPCTGVEVVGGGDQPVNFWGHGGRRGAASTHVVPQPVDGRLVLQGLPFGPAPADVGSAPQGGMGVKTSPQDQGLPVGVEANEHLVVLHRRARHDVVELPGATVGPADLDDRPRKATWPGAVADQEHRGRSEAR